MTRQLTHSLQSSTTERDLPLSSLLVQDTMTALLAANMLTASESHARRAVTADVGDRGAVDGHTAALVGKGILATHRGHLVGFTRHDGMSFFFCGGRGCDDDERFCEGRRRSVVVLKFGSG